MIYVDEPFEVEADHPTAPRIFKGRKSAHLMADSEHELIAYAIKIGMKPLWIQYPGTYRVHFDVTGTFLAKVLKDAANEIVRQVTSLEMVIWYVNRRQLAQSQNQTAQG